MLRWPPGRSPQGSHVRLFLDEDIASKELISRLNAAGHWCGRGLIGAGDSAVWGMAQEARAAVLTRNVRDFLSLADRTTAHHGLILNYQKGDARRDMSVGEIAAAIQKVDATLGSDLSERIVVLNQFR